MGAVMSGEAAREMLRREHGVRKVTAAEEGFAAAHLPAGVYGFTSAPALESPLFAVRQYRNFEIHHTSAGISVIGFVTPAEASQLARAQANEVVTVLLHPEIEEPATVIVSIPYDRVNLHRQYSVRNAPAISLRVTPTGQASAV
jgi:hypothetical protein